MLSRKKYSVEITLYKKHLFFLYYFYLLLKISFTNFFLNLFFIVNLSLFMY